MSEPSSHGVARHLDANGVASLGRTLFTNTEPASPDDTLTVYDAGGEPPILYDEVLTSHDVQLRARARRYADAYKMLDDAFAVLNAAKGVTIQGYRYTGIWLMSDIISLGNDENGRATITANYQLVRHKI